MVGGRPGKRSALVLGHHIHLSRNALYGSLRTQLRPLMHPTVYEPANEVKPRKNQEWHYNRETPCLADSQTCQTPDNSGTDHKRGKRTA